MTKKQFEKKYPKGLNNTIVNFEKSLYKIMISDEIDKIINCTKGKEKRWLKQFRIEYRDLIKDWSDLPIWESLMVIKSPRLLSDIISYMVTSDDSVYQGEDLK